MNTQAQKHSRSTQVRGPRKEVTPLLLPISLYISLNHKYKRLLELYDPNHGDEHEVEDEAMGGKESPGLVPHAGGGEALFIG